MNEELLEQQITDLTKQVIDLTNQALESPAGMESVAKRLKPLKIYVDSGYSGCRNKRGVMRGIAERVFPPNWDWDLVEFVGGECTIVVNNVRMMD